MTTTGDPVGDRRARSHARGDGRCTGSQPNRLVLGGIDVDVCTDDELMALAREHLGGGDEPLVVASANLDHIHHFGRGGENAAALRRAEDGARWLFLLDGMPLVWRARRYQEGVRARRLAGADLLLRMLQLGRQEGRRVGFLGGTAEMHQALRAFLAEQLPGLPVAGMWAPSRADLADEHRNRDLAAAVRASGCDLLVVGLGKPRQELWVAEYGSLTGAPVVLLFGAAADFLTGRVRRAPRVMQATGLEWLYRLLVEPRRMSRRYLVQGPPALLQLVRAG